MSGLGGHQSARMVGDVWLTPPGLIKALGRFDLDPASPEGRPWPTAGRHFTIRDDGLVKPWSKRVWLNPPYGPPKTTGPWLRKMAKHANGTMLIAARTETALFFETVWNAADALLFLEGRLFFYFPDADPKAKCMGGSFGAHEWEEKAASIKGQQAPLGCAHCGISRANSGAPSVLVAYGQQDALILKTCNLSGAFIDLRLGRS